MTHVPPLLDYIPNDDDGYTLDAYIESVPRLHNSVRVSYRPTEILERAVLIEINRASTEKDVSVRFAELLEKKITKWDIQQRTKDGVLVPLPISKANVLRLKPSLWLRLLNIVLWGSDGGDVDPGQPMESMAKQTDADFDALLRGEKIVDVRLEADRKN
jgi:hypothetical protein